MGKDQSGKKEKKQKQKITYIDDGSSISDMSGVSRNSGFGFHSGKKASGQPKPIRRRSTFREQWNTYVQSVRMMFFPMLVVIGIICVVFLLMYLFLR